MPADGSTFSPVGTGGKSAAAVAVGPGSNTGQKGAGALVDYFTAVFSAARLEESGLSDLRALLGTLFGSQGELIPGAIREKPWQFYSHSAVIFDREGEMVGRIGLGGNRETVCVSLSGAGCKWVKNWHTLAAHGERLRGKISRCDVAFDDYEGERLDVHALRERAAAGEFAEGGRPPSHRFLSDEGHGTGCTLYVGSKGHKELCVYEKGKQLGVSSSRWVRAEVRLYGKHVAVPWDVLRQPADYLRGAYSVLAELVQGVVTRLRTMKKTVECSATAAAAWARRQVGPTLRLFVQAFGVEWIADHIAREGSPGRFRGIPEANLVEMIRSEMPCPSSA